MVLAETFGQSGTAVDFFGGQWEFVGLFMLIIFVTFLMTYKVPAQAITTFIIIGFLSISGYSLFVIQQQITQTILFMLFIFVGFIAYLFFSR